MTSPTSASGSSPHSIVLIVEDSWPERSRLKVMLQRMGHKVYEACDGRSGLEMCRAVKPDVIISDWVMPGMDGLDLCHALQQNNLSDAHIMMLTSRQATADAIASMDAGADDFQTKPIEAEELRARIQAALRRRKRARAQAKPD